MFKFFNEIRRDEEGATAIEYGLIAALVAIGLITALGQLSTSVDGLFNEVQTSVGAVNGQDTDSSDGNS